MRGAFPTKRGRSAIVLRKTAVTPTWLRDCWSCYAELVPVISLRKGSIVVKASRRYLVFFRSLLSTRWSLALAMNVEVASPSSDSKRAFLLPFLSLYPLAAR